MQRYACYKESGVEWIGEIPEHWKIYRYKNILLLEQGQAFKSSEYVDMSDIVSVRMGNIKKGGYIDLNHNVKYLPNDYLEKYSKFQLFENDLIIAMTDMSPSLEFLAVPAFMQDLENDKVYLLNQRVGKILHKKNFEIRYIKYLLLSYQLREQLKSLGLGTVQSNMSNENLYNTLLVAPDKYEQIVIANFLDKKTAEIDALITQKEQLLSLYEEEKAAIINQAVTKGIDPDATMKESGVPWLGEIPEHWDTTSLKWISKIYSGGTPDRNKDEYWFNGNIPWLNSGTVNQFIITEPSEYITEDGLNNSSAKWINENSLVIALAGQGKTKGMVAQVTFLTTCNQSLGVIEPLSLISSKFLLYFIKRNYLHIRGLAGEGKRDGLNLEIIGSISIPVFDINEQNSIVEYIELETKKIDKKIGRTKQIIALQKEYRTALISEVVTGKIKVPEEM